MTKLLEKEEKEKASKRLKYALARNEDFLLNTKGADVEYRDKRDSADVEYRDVEYRDVEYRDSLFFLV